MVPPGTAAETGAGWHSSNPRFTHNRNSNLRITTATAADFFENMFVIMLENLVLARLLRYASKG